MRFRHRNRHFGHLKTVSDFFDGREALEGARVVVTHADKAINHQQGVLGKPWCTSGRHWVHLDTGIQRNGLTVHSVHISTGCIYLLEYPRQGAEVRA